MERRLRGQGLLLIAFVVLVGACAGRARSVPGEDRPSSKFTATSYSNRGTEAEILVDVRAARLRGPSDFLPLLLAIENKTDVRWTIDRESIVLELPDGRTIPLASFEEYEKDYGRGRADVNAAAPFLASLQTTFPQPPFRWLPLDFFPPRGSSTFPRDEVDFRRGELVYGYVYFRLPPSVPASGRYKLVLSPRGAPHTFVVDLEPFGEAGRSS